MRILNLLLTVALMFSVGAYAQTKPAKKPAPASSGSSGSSGGMNSGSTDDVPWGMAGCSIWNYAIKDKGQGAQIGVWALEHFVFGVQISAITSGTLNCVDPSMRNAANEQEVFVTVNLASLQKEAAQGQGEHLDALAEIFGCQDKEGFAHMSQSRYETIFANEKPAQVLHNYKSEIKSGKSACSRAG